MGQTLLVVRVGHKDVARDHAPLEGPHVTRHVVHSCHGLRTKPLICREAHAPQLRNLSRLVAKDRRVHVVVAAVGRDHDVAHVDARIEGPGDAGVHHVRHAIAVYQHLHAHAGVDLANAGAHHDHRHAA